MAPTTTTAAAKVAAGAASTAAGAATITVLARTAVAEMEEEGKKTVSQPWTKTAGFANAA